VEAADNGLDVEAEMLQHLGRHQLPRILGRLLEASLVVFL
jgi:hypothetical protein